MKKPALTDPCMTVGVAIGLILSVGFFGPYLGVVMLPGWVVLLAWGLVRWRKRKPVSRVFNGALSVLLGVILFVGLVLLGQTRQVEHKMLWEVEGVTDGSSFCPAGEDEVRLRFVEFRGYVVTEYSKELAAFLRGSGKREVTVRFDVTYDFFRCEGFTRWRSKGGASTGKRAIQLIS